ncbi:Flp pilus assembly protein, ATPase CpaF [Brachybacterium faecium]|uniref:Flp pilus assembly protein, ATPase CpaF n=1 Tax=Brachybacterium faecium (strain ATCC 43885 / DSM 4810 / JCM 11609 / LMG 19847 / NBRC 14762 / NCIMB 9860 / 6-10) TaxID=446465 RepID=C7MGD0_BRAFD|nr:TadA family conjugal transfer-associated ATPase [Brachybacterium faecium]ACU86363.1 Flp pilus assembly protein, ATPase CpaF [Brachybacterium faecium DSM 4810]SLM94432.1 Flp pilus assembly protein, ATPase CpaF [Brachybacterium faecium]HJG52773.1 TadA family conjugal transfer-associated ATPase [Brachybacterium faecium]
MSRAGIAAQEDLGPLLELVREDLVRSPGAVDVPRIVRVLGRQGRVLGAAATLELTARIRDHVDGLGPLQSLVAPDVTDLLVNDDGTVWVDGAEGLHRTAVRLGPAQARDLAVRLATVGGRRLDDAMPWADAHLPSGIRFHAVLPPLSPGGAILSLRLPSARRLDLADLEELGALVPEAREALRAIIAARVPFLITGGTGTGKSTLLAAMLGQAPAGERIVVVEDVLELAVEHPHVVHLQARHANSEGAGAVDLTALVRQSLRMRPDRIVLGECRGGEIRELLQALNTGHDGGCGTVHANTAADVPARLEALGALGGLDRAALASQVASALEVVIHLGRRDGRRALEEVAVLRRGSDGLLETATALRVQEGRLEEGPAAESLARRLAGSPSPLTRTASAPRAAPAVRTARAARTQRRRPA